ncbi:MAG: hypothetical protein ACKN9V_10840, partial [Pseudomonadota bacterium]
LWVKAAGVLFRESLRYIVRSKLLLLLLVFSFLLHYVGLSFVKQATFSIQGLVSTVGPREGLFVSIYLSLFMGVFLSAIYGVWMVPYLHQGERSLLTFVLPVSKWIYPCVYCLSFLILILLEFGILLGAFYWVFGKEAILHPKFSWTALATCLFVELLAFEFLLFFFGILSMVVGQVMTLFFAAGSFIALQVAGTIFRFGMGESWTLYKIYQYLPPLGELIFNLKQTFSQGIFPVYHVLLWFVWFVFGFVLFRISLRYSR